MFQWDLNKCRVRSGADNQMVRIKREDTEKYFKLIKERLQVGGLHLYEVFAFARSVKPHRYLSRSLQYLKILSNF